MFLRKVSTKKNGKEYVYVKLIESYRADGKVKQRVVANFGSLDTITPTKIQGLINSLGKLYQELSDNNQQEITLDKHRELREVKQQLISSSTQKTLGLLVKCPREQELTQALFLRYLVGGGGSLSIQEYCQKYKLANGTNIQFYQLMKKLGQEETRKVLYEQWLQTKCCEKGRNKVVYIHILPAVFQGVTQEGEYKKQLILFLASDHKGIILDFDYAEGLKHLSYQLNSFVGRLKGQGQAEVIVLDGENLLQENSTNYRIARLAQNSTGVAEDSFKLLQQLPQSTDKQKGIQARIARAAAGLEMLKADILMGKLTKEAVVMKKAEAILRDNQCQGLISYYWDLHNQTLGYQTNQLALDNLNQEVITSRWYVRKDEHKPLHNLLQINLQDFSTIKDQLQVPLVNICAEYHYAPEIISAHILLAMLKSQHEYQMKISNQEVGNQEYLQCCM
ncbi:hypothetical protein [Desulforamulus ferrireducens]|uniref:Uncharacterized protein n=1 Tax=Desulforamulus ferrireducens TaxID=1833852 RepID=A0A1S6ITQ4_9FIRM|nr:hypothetical protein [Desulforamulus ferrireducens]AQS58154.1 hypothetical protein B0537_03025 [Desulforamulus ferrireducens]